MRLAVRTARTHDRLGTKSDWGMMVRPLTPDRQTQTVDKLADTRPQVRRFRWQPCPVVSRTTRSCFDKATIKWFIGHSKFGWFCLWIVWDVKLLEHDLQNGSLEKCLLRCLTWAFLDQNSVPLLVFDWYLILSINLDAGTGLPWRLYWITFLGNRDGE